MHTQAMAHLRQDPTMAGLIERHTLRPLATTDGTDSFRHLVGSIVSQQLSVKVADVIEARLVTLLDGRISPAAIVQMDTEAARACGLSYAKIRYIKAAADSALSGAVAFDRLSLLSDEEVIQHLITIPGVGRWTAEMLLIFNLGREDVFSLGDQGLRNAVARHYGVDKRDLPSIEAVSLAWAPYRSFASRYLWASLDNEPAGIDAA